MSVKDRLKEMGISLPEPPQPAGSYTKAVRSGNLLFISGQLPLVKGVVQHGGIVGEDITTDQGQEAARLCALNALSILEIETGSLDSVRILRIGGYVCSAPGFTGQAQVINGASDLLAAILGERGVHSRLAVGVQALPLGASVELEVIAEVED